MMSGLERDEAEAEGASEHGDTGTWDGHEDRRTRGPERVSAKVQIGAELLCKSAKVRDSVSGGRWRAIFAR